MSGKRARALRKQYGKLNSREKRKLKLAQGRGGRVVAQDKRKPKVKSIAKPWPMQKRQRIEDMRKQIVAQKKEIEELRRANANLRKINERFLLEIRARAA